MSERFTGGDHFLIEAACCESQAAQIRRSTAEELNRPFYKLRPAIYPDGDQWCVLYGANLQEGVAGFGDTPEKAAMDFDHNWKYQLARKVKKKK